MHVIDISTDVGGEILAGAADGALAQAKLIAHASQFKSPGVVFLDFQNVQVATGSFLREAVLGFRWSCRRVYTYLQPVVANANAKIVQELELVLSATGQAIAACELDVDRCPHNARVLGHLEEAQHQTLIALLDLGEADAARLRATASDIEGTGPKSTAWNNRLAGLVEKSLLVEEKRGRRKWYRPVLKELCYGR